VRWSSLAATAGVALSGCGAHPPAIELDVSAASTAYAAAASNDAPYGGLATPLSTERAAPPISFVAWGDEVVERSRRSRRPVLLVVCAEWAVRCQSLGRDVFADRDVRRMARSYLPAWLDATDTSKDMDERVRGLHLAGFPAIVLLDAGEDARLTLPASISPRELADQLETFSRRE
jgi:thiol:disulfide interchange protein